MHNLENIVFWLSLAVVVGALVVWAWWMLAVVAERPAPRKAQEWTAYKWLRGIAIRFRYQAAAWLFDLAARLLPIAGRGDYGEAHHVGTRWIEWKVTADKPPTVAWQGSDFWPGNWGKR